ncbi:MAG: hypothetical protein GY777_15925 [Candidatus Brocadiaceae bacterium]|nr:hypothetical protein [Candidatus Brocadiaceae bacterium]
MHRKGVSIESTKCNNYWNSNIISLNSVPESTYQKLYKKAIRKKGTSKVAYLLNRLCDKKPHTEKNLKKFRGFPPITLLIFCMLISLLTIAVVPVGAEDKKSTHPAKAVCTESSNECTLINTWFSEGTAAGNISDFYDNRDGGHSSLQMNWYPQLSVVTYTENEKQKRMDYGGQVKLLPHVTIGNSSTSASVSNGGSQPRSMYYTSYRGLAFLYAQYRNSNLYVYPEHRDHDAGHNGRPGYGDIYPTNTPYLIISQGSSGSDMLFLKAVTKTLASFRPKVKKRMIETGLLMPTIQMLFRTSNRNIQQTQEYLTYKAHPTVFNGSMIDSQKMVQQARKIKLNNIPPMIQLDVITENNAINGIDYFETGASEKLCDTPAVIARIFRGTSQKKRIVVSAKSSFDINKRPLTYYWKVLCGDSERIEIHTKSNGAIAELVIPYHRRMPISNDSPMESNRVDIGVFVHNGTWYSSPGFITFFFLDNEARTYDSRGQLLEIYYSASDTSIGYKTENPQSFINKKYPIFNWKNLFVTILSNSENLPTLLFREKLTDEQTNAIAHAAATFEPLHHQLKQIYNELKIVNSNQKKNRKQLKSAKLQLDKAQADVEKYPRPQTLLTLDNAESEHELAIEERTTLIETKRRLRKEIKELKESTKNIFLNNDKRLPASIKDFVEKILNNILNDPDLYINYQQAIHDLMANATQEQQKHILTARNKLVGYGILKKVGTELFKRHSVLSNLPNNPQTLTAGEKNLISEFNLVLMNQLLFPDFLLGKITKNFVDYRLTTVKKWRDVYQYDSLGKISGWHRYDGDSVAEYTPDGKIVIGKDKSGCVLKTQGVKYALDKQSKTLKVIPADDVVQH